MPKPKGTPGGNKNPVQNAELKAKQYKRVDADAFPLDDRPTGINLFAIDGQLLRASEMTSQERAAWLRRVIHAAVEAELLPRARVRAREMLAAGMSADEVAAATGLLIVEVEGLQQT